MIRFNKNKHLVFFIEIVVLCLIIVGGLFLRSWKLGEQSLWIDEGFTINGSLAVLDRGLPVLDSGEFYKNGILSTYIVAGVIKVFDLDPFNPWPMRLPAVFFGTCAIFFAWFLYREVFKDNFGALVVAFITSFSYWEIAWSRQVRGYAMISCFILMALVFLWRFFNTKRTIYFVTANFIFFLAYLSQESGIAFLFASLCLSTLVFYEKIYSKKQNQIKFYYGFTANVCFLMIGLGLLFPEYLNVFKSSFLYQLSGELIVFMIGAFVAILLSFKAKSEFKGITFFSILVCIGATGIVLFSPAPQLRYFFPFFVLLIILTVSGMRIVVNKLNINFKDVYPQYVCFGLLLFFIFPYLNFKPLSHYWLETGSPQPDFKSVFKVIEKEKSQGDVVISGYTALNKIFSGQKGLWLKMNFSGRPKNEEGITLDYYTGAPVINNVSDLQNIVNMKHGFIVIDAMTRAKLPEIHNYVVESHLITKVFSSNEKSDRKINLYRF